MTAAEMDAYEKVCDDMLTNVEAAIEAPKEVPTHLVGEIFIPLIKLTNSPLSVGVMETFEEPLRYFKSAQNNIIAGLNRVCKPEIIKSAGLIRVADLYSWKITYAYYTPTYFYQNSIPGMKLLIITKLEDIYSIDCPIEFREALMKVVFTELAK